MARCSCGNATCSCVVKAVPNSGVVVTGDGSPARPFQVGLTSSGQVTNVIDVGDTATLNLSKSGAGTTADHLVIYGTATVKMTDLTDVSDPTPPVNGDVPVWTNGHWEFKPPPTAPPGAVSVSNGLSGDGSGASPLTIRTTGAWGTDPLLTTVFGAAQDFGNELYLDSTGALRTRPQHLADNLHPATDLPSLYPLGVSLMAVGATFGAANGWTGTGTVMTVSGHDGSRFTQFWIKNTGTDAATHIRVRFAAASAGPWSGWRDLLAPPLPDPVDTYVATDQTISATARVSETPTAVRASIVNPHPYRRMLCRNILTCWNQWTALPAAVSSFYFDTYPVSGSQVNAVNASGTRYDVPTSGTTYRDCIAEANMWVPAGGTVVTGVGATRGSSTGTCVIRYVHNEIIPLRYE